MPARRSRPRKRAPNGRDRSHVERPDPVETASVCYFCSGPIGPHDRIRRFHELTVHEGCYTREIHR